MRGAACVTRVGLKGISQDTFLELGNGQKYLSRGYVPDVPIVTSRIDCEGWLDSDQPAARGGPRAGNELVATSQPWS